MSSSSRPRKRSIEKVAHKIGKMSLTDPDHSCEKVCRGCHRRYVPPKFPLGSIISNPDSPYHAIPGMLLSNDLWPFVDEMFAKSDDKTIVISAITNEIREHSQLLDLLKPFGEVSSATLDRALGGRFAFVNFVNKEDAEKALNTLNGGDPRGYDKRVLQVHWASNLKKST